MTTVIAIDSSGPVTAIGLGDQDAPGFAVGESGGRRHAEVIDGLMRQVLPRCRERPDAIAVGVGPGPYSGLRVGIAFAIGLGRAWQRPVVGVCSLDAIAWSVAEAGEEGEFIVTTDARRGETYWAHYDAQGTRIAGPRVIARSDADAGLRRIDEREVDVAAMAWRVAGFLERGCEPMAATGAWAPHGSDAAEVSVPSGPLLAPRPLYLRAPDITWSAKTRTEANP